MDQSTPPGMDPEFLDGSQNADACSDGSLSPSDQSGSKRSKAADGGAGAIRRIACVICRKRKLKCDGARPSCYTCSRLGHKCGYDDIRKKSGPKRGYVKELEARLIMVESQLKSKQSTPQTQQQMGTSSQLGSLDAGLGLGAQPLMNFSSATGGADFTSGMTVPNVMVTTEQSAASNTDFPWEMIGLGLEEPLPPQDMIDELHQIYFDKLHYTMPMIHKYRYLAAMNLAPNMRPAICLRYSIWAMSCSIVDKYSGYSDIFYQRARKYAEGDEMKGHGETFVTVGHCQTWSLIAMFEFKMLYFPRAWMSAGRAARLATMLSLHRQDGPSLEVKQTLPPPRDWTDAEERRRTFWMAYCVDRYASIGTGWPMSLDELDISTNLPSSNESYEKGRKEETQSLAEAMTADGAPKISSFAGVVVMACIFGKNLTHLHRANDSDSPEDPSGEFWKRHQKLDNILITTSMYLPDHLKLPAYAKDPNVVALNMYIHSATICLHQAAILKAEKHKMNSSSIRESTDRCFLAANAISSLMKMVTPLDMAHMNPFTSFCLYVAARVFLHAYAKQPANDQIREPLFFLLSAMQAHRSKNNITESFLVQLQVEMDAAGLEHPLHNRNTYRGSKASEALYEEGRNCPPVFQPHSDTQPSYPELHQQASPGAGSAAARSRAESPQHIPQTIFAVPTRGRQKSGMTPGAAAAAAAVAQQRRQSQVSPQGWGDHPAAGSFGGAFAGDAEISSDGAPTPATGSQRASSHPSSYSPHSHSEPSAMEALHAATAGQQPQFFPGPAGGGFGQFAGQHEFPPAAAGPHDMGVGMGSAVQDWGIDSVPGLADGSWAMDGMSWEDGAGMPHGLGSWRPMSSSTGP